MAFDAGGIDPSSLHLKKELTQIRKAARGLRDPGTSSSGAARRRTPPTKHHYVHHRKVGPPPRRGNAPSPPISNADDTSNDDSSNKGNGGVEEREKRVFLYNWRRQTKDFESRDGKTKQVLGEDVDDDDEEESFLSSSSKSDAYFKRREADFTKVKNKTRRSGGGYRNSVPILEKKMLPTGSLAVQSDGDYLNSDDLASRGFEVVPPLRVRFNKIRGRANLLRKEDDFISYSPRSYQNNKNGISNPSTVRSWNSLNNADDEVDEEHLEQQGCGIPRYWSKRSTPKSRFGYGSGSCGSPSITDSFRRKWNSLSVTQTINRRRRSGPNTWRQTSRIPLLTSDEDDDLASNFEELDLEASSRLDRKKWSSSFRTPEGLELVVVDDHEEEEGSPENARSLSHKYRPVFFEELVGQNIVVQSLKSSISRKRIDSVYLFHGPRGTGKMSAARIFATALNCLATEENNNNNKPCGVCTECASFIYGKNEHITEVDGSNKADIEKIRDLLNSLSEGRGSDFSHFNVFVVDECHLLPSKMWLGFLSLVEKPLPNVIFVLVTTEMDNLPRSVLSRCQKHLFSKIGNSDIVARLRKIGENEDLDVDRDALEMIAMNVDGSLWDAETMLDQLSLFGKRIEVSLVNELIGVVSDEKLLELLELAMSSNSTETVIRARELMDSGVDPIVLMSQMATLIVDIIAGTYPGGDEKHESFFGVRDLSGKELDRLKHALNLLSEAEKHLRLSSDKSTWFTATLLQLASGGPSSWAHSTSSRHQNSKATEDDCLSSSGPGNSIGKDNNNNNNNNNNNRVPDNSSNLNKTQFSGQALVSKDGGRSFNSKTLANIWEQCVEKCHSKTLRELLHAHGRIVSISEVKGGFVAHIGFTDPDIKTRAEGFLSSITNSFEILFRHNVEVKIVSLANSFHLDKNSPEKTDPSETEARNADVSLSKEAKSGIPGRRIESIIQEQRLETAWLKSLDTTPRSSGPMKPEKNQVSKPLDTRGTPRSSRRMKPERNQVLPHDVPYESRPSDPIMNDKMVGSEKDGIVARKGDHIPISPSLLHNSATNLSSENKGYKSGPKPSCCGAMLCWNNRRPGEVKLGTPQHKSGRCLWF